MIDGKIAKKYLIWSEEKGAWLRASWGGYTQKMGEAGQYSLGSAQNICRETNAGGNFCEVHVEVPFGLETLSRLPSGGR